MIIYFITERLTSLPMHLLPYAHIQVADDPDSDSEPRHKTPATATPLSQQFDGTQTASQPGHSR